MYKKFKYVKYQFSRNLKFKLKLTKIQNEKYQVKSCFSRLTEAKVVRN